MNTKAKKFGSGCGRCRERWVALLVVLLAATLFSACDKHDDNGPVDVSPPAIPAGVYSITGDQTIFLRWIPNHENDLAGYRIYRNTDEINTSDYLYPGPTDGLGDDFIEYPDAGLTNGTDYYYAVSAFDRHGLESGLSLEFVVDTPRPEEVANPLRLYDASLGAADAALSGYDFSSLSNTPQSNALGTTDLYFASDTVGSTLVGYLVVPSNRVQIQDYGNVDFDTASWAPTDGWSAVGKVEAILYHTYVLDIYDLPGLLGDHHYAKITVVDHLPDSVRLQWGYQTVPGLRELSVPNTPSNRPAPTEASS
jgi:hypothetical protein